MSRQILSTDRAPSSSLFSQGVKVGSVIYVSGMTGTDVATGRLRVEMLDVRFSIMMTAHLPS